jgi:threonine aldolase
VIDLRSDVKSQPTPEMRRAMAEAEVGDDAAGEDPTVRRLEERAAAATGKAAAVFVTSGTQGNLVSLLALTTPGEEMIADEQAHLLHYEGGGCARVAGLLPRTLKAERGCLDPEDVAANISEGSTTRGRTGAVILENTHNGAGGVAVEPERMQAVAEVALRRGVKVHLDGARIFNAAVALGRPVTDFTEWCHTAMFCFSKSLGAPAGSVVCGPEDVVERARRGRRMLGGSMRQAGHLAAAALVAMDTMVDRLAEDHRHAREIAETLAGLPGVEVDLGTVQTNMVYFRLAREDMTDEEFARAMEERGVLTGGPHPLPRTFRLVTYHNVDDAATEAACAALQEVLGG